MVKKDSYPSENIFYDRENYQKQIKNSRLIAITLENIVSIQNLKTKKIGLQIFNKYRVGNSLIFESKDQIMEKDIANMITVHAPLGTTHYDEDLWETTVKLTFYQIYPEEARKYSVKK